MNRPVILDTVFWIMNEWCSWEVRLRSRCYLWDHLIETSSIVSYLLLSRSCFLYLSIPHTLTMKSIGLTAVNTVIWSHTSSNMRDAFHFTPLFSFSFSFSLQPLSLNWTGIFLIILFLLLLSKMAKNAKKTLVASFFFLLRMVSSPIPCI